MANENSITTTFQTLLTEAVSKPGLMMEAYRAFHTYSVGNQLLALFQCAKRGLPAGPINTYPGWQRLSRQVRKGERALELVMPISHKRTEKNENGEDVTKTWQSFTYRRNWFSGTSSSAKSA